MLLEYLLLFMVILIPMAAQGYIMFVINLNKGKINSRGLTGYQVARAILDSNGLNNVNVVEVGGSLTDHYDPTTRKVCLSTDICRGNSISSISVAAHECGHAIQDKEGYLFLKIRTAIFPVVNFCSSFAYWLILLGLFLEYINLLYIGICFSFIGLIFQIITLPVEFNASKRAIKKLEEYNIVDSSESRACTSVLRAAAFTYVAGTIAAALQIVRYVLMARSRD